MGGPRNHPQPNDFNDWMRQIERRMLAQERRSPVFELQRTLGAGFGRYATQIFDWNSEEAWFSGTYWTPANAFNAPVPATIFVGTVLSVAAVGGVQEAVSLDGTPDHYQRVFTLTPGGTPTFSAWAPA